MRWKNAHKRKRNKEIRNKKPWRKIFNMDAVAAAMKEVYFLSK